MLKAFVIAFLVICIGRSNVNASQCGLAVKPPFLSRSRRLADNLIRASDSGRIVGGVEAIPHSWPWQVALMDGSGLRWKGCGGAIINNQWILSAAHCTQGPTNGYSIRVGAHNLKETDENTKTYAVEKIISHPRYNIPFLTHNLDISLIKLSTPLTFSSDVSPVCLADHSDGNPGQTCYATGWGSIAHGGYVSDVLRQVDVVVTDPEQCSDEYPGRITPEMICAKNPGKDSCSGDSGGPLVCRSQQGTFKLVGVVSWGIGCADPRYSGVYARTTSALDWIADIVATH